MSRSPLSLTRFLLYSTAHRPPPRLPPLHLFSTFIRSRQLSSTAPLRAQAKPAAVPEQQNSEIIYIHPHLDLMDLPTSLLPNWPVGELMYVQGSTGSSYALTRHSLNNYSCSCPAWKFQKGQTSEVRTCKHLREMLGDEHENARTGTVPSGKKKAPKKRPAAAAAEDDNAEVAPPVKKKAAPRKKKAAEDAEVTKSGFTPLLLAQSFELGGKKSPEGMLVSEKLDGVRAYWDGIDTVWSRTGKPFSPPKFFLDHLPRNHSLDGELYLGRDRFDETSGTVRTTNGTDASAAKWKEMKFMVFDIPSIGKQPFEARLEQLRTLFPADKEGPVQVVKHEICKGIEDLNERLTEIQKVDGEGLMLRDPDSKYVGKRDKSLLKVKTFYDAEAKVVGYEPGKGKYALVTGSLICEMESGQQFSVGSGLSDARRADPPQLGAIISYRFQELTKANVPRFPTFVGERADMDEPKDCVVRTSIARTNVGGGDE